MEELPNATHRRLYPPLTDPNYLALRSRRMIFTKWVGQIHKKGMIVLDIGGRYQPYRPLLQGLYHRYFSVDLIKTEHVSVVADAEQLPFPPGSFDLAIATQVFEYIRDPYAAVRQMCDALRPGGILLASFAACTPRVADEEFWRFTPSGFRLLLEPFATVEIVPEMHSIAGLVRTINLGLDTFVRYEAARRAYRMTVCPVLNLLGRGLETMNLGANDLFTTNYSVRATKAG